MSFLLKALQYPHDVLDGDIVAGELTKLACKRWFDDLERAKTDPNLRFNDEKAEYALNVMHCMVHVKGELAGQPIDLMPWQSWVVANLHGWEMCREGRWTRRFRKFYAEVARKNAKSTLLSGLGLLATGFDDEGGAEVYAAATTRDQARIVYGDALQMVRSSPIMRSLFKPLRTHIEEKSGSGIFAPLSSDANTLDGRNPSFAIVDEYHAHRTSELYDVLESGMGARLNPMLGIITTSGFNLQSPCYTLRKQYIEPLLKGQIEDDSYFALVYTLDEGDDPFDESVWMKANPSLGVAKRVDVIREEANKAKSMPTARANFLTKHMNIWVQSSSAFIDLQDWAKCPSSLEDHDLIHAPCFIGIDLARQWDWTCVVAVFKLTDGTYDVRSFNYLPEDTVERVPKQTAEIYRKFIDDGSLILTSGNVVDQTIIRDKVIELCATYNVKEIAYDQYNASWLLTELQGLGAELVSVSQSARGLSAAMGETAARIMKGTMRNPNSSAYSWHLGNVVLKQMDAKNMIPVKEHQDAKIDAAVATFMAVNRAMSVIEQDLSGFLSGSSFIPRG